MESTKAFEEKLGRIFEATGVKKDTELAKVLGIKAPSVAGARKREQIPSGWIEKVASEFDVSADWLFFGVGQMRRDGGIPAVKEIWTNSLAAKYLIDNAHKLSVVIEIQFMNEVIDNGINHLLKFKNGAVQLVRSELSLDKEPRQHEIELIRKSFQEVNVQTISSRMTISELDGLARFSPWYGVVKTYEDIVSASSPSPKSDAPPDASPSSQLLAAMLDDERKLNKELSAENRQLLKENGDIRVEVTELRVRLDIAEMRARAAPDKMSDEDFQETA
ncbi:helix-turn-helix domain-containing protein [Pseudodesulfovibrio thermohalotolerans]|uniref:helix-turn-helix domain-containing protein n=1 Tax=Pseudodesulfovibrio thermohalotolerans TaxID=2880651 RepID=UPI0024434FB2|nr:helix-turn-helix domain-containing protein [Pseudodesulfovibrio thermohalotolerans]WFS61293.1 helix-turn-helix domain-containing protein [Pseudodesulfovibrio thermohalotolerans]